MKNVCDTCKYAKNKGEFIFCVKYGVPIWSDRIHCIAWERSEKIIEIRQQEDSAGWDHIRQSERSSEIL